MRFSAESGNAPPVDYAMAIPGSHITPKDCSPG
jgi:hypothetical protein